MPEDRRVVCRLVGKLNSNCARSTRITVFSITIAGMKDRAEILRRRIAAYRCYLTMSTDVAIVRQFLREIAMDEAELAAIVDEGQKENGRRQHRPRFSPVARTALPRTS
jgi:hypothetical protein